MSGNSFGTAFRVTTFGESHGAGLGAVIDGCPAGLTLTEADIQAELDRRRPGQSEIATKRKEPDRVEILSGVFENLTTGAPIGLLVRNEDANPGAYESIKDLARPGHADFGFTARYGYRDYRGGGRSSGRETLARVAAGAVAKKLLARSGVKVYAHTRSIGDIVAKEPGLDEIVNLPYTNQVRCADMGSVDAMIAAVEQARDAGDSIGGTVESIAVGVPAGLGEPVFGKLDAELACALMGIGGVKGVEIGLGFQASKLKGSQMNDAFYAEQGEIATRTNHCGGVLGGISTGAPIVCRVGIKPTPSIGQRQDTVNIKTLENVPIEIRGRHDPSIVPRAVPVIEAMMALVLVDHMIRSGKIDPLRVQR